MRCVEGVGLVWEVLTSGKLLNYQWCVCVLDNGTANMCVFDIVPSYSGRESAQVMVAQV